MIFLLRICANIKNLFSNLKNSINGDNYGKYDILKVKTT
jgi:hypothetical protein